MALGEHQTIIFGVIFGITPMKNKDMSPKINAGDLMLFYRLENNFSIRDVVIFEKDGVSYTGRIIAKDGDTVEITNEAEVKVNGIPRRSGLRKMALAKLLYPRSSQVCQPVCGVHP